MNNPIKTKWQQGKAILNAWLSIPSSISAELTARLGFDSVTIDMQHGLMHYDHALPMLQAIHITSVPGLARIPWNEPGIIMKMLDAGCLGIICPMISSREECEAFVKACRYPPHGYRSFGPTRASLYYGQDYFSHANTNVLTFAMIETPGAMEQLDAIMSVPGLDAIYVGPADLSQALGGLPGADWEEGPVPAALDKILASAKRNNILAGIHTGSVSYAKKMVDLGFQFITVQSELQFLRTAATQVVAEFNQSSGIKSKDLY
jgi:4-hydroxy-2-oxoheptanedioate aldolase